MPYKPVMLMILDGWGLRTCVEGNAVVQGNTPHYDKWNTTFERSVIDASGEAVGLVAEQMGNSEVGHLNLGAGRIVYQDISRIDNAVHNGSLSAHPLLIGALEKVRANNGKLHLIGLLGAGGVHAIDRHQFALLSIAHESGLRPVVHVITDGRDTPPNSGIDFLAEMEQFLRHGGIEATIATVGGRYYIMDRDKRWERTAKAYSALVKGEGERAASPEQAIRQSYEAGTTDEFILPTVIESGKPGLVEPGDCLLFFNFRADRMRQIVRLFAFESFEGRPNVGFVPDLTILTMTQYEENFPADVLFPMEIVSNPLAEVISDAGKKQFHMAETEKYPHVTYFFNGRREEPFEGEERHIVPSPKVATYDLQPEMSAPEAARIMLDRIRNQDDDFLLINFANPDMVGHTGSLPAAIRAVETVDELAGQLVEAVVAKGGAAIVTADHGNCEVMVDPFSKEPHTYHTTNPVTLHVIGEGISALRARGILADVAPTILDLMGLAQPPEMTGVTLIKQPDKDKE